MESMIAQLQEHYASMETDELVELRARNGLTDIARKILENELRVRGIDQARITDERQRQEETEQHREVVSANLASIGSRFFAKMIDFLGSMFIMGSISFVAYVSMPKSFSDPLSNASIIAWLLYLLFKDGMNGQSYGKRWLKIKVIEKTSGDLCSLPRSAIRNLFGCLAVLDWVWALGKDRQRLGDIVAGTIVVRALSHGK